MTFFPSSSEVNFASGRFSFPDRGGLGLDMHIFQSSPIVVQLELLPSKTPDPAAVWPP